MDESVPEIVRVPESVQRIAFTLPLQMTKASYKDGELRLVYDIGIDTLPVFNEAAARVQFEIRFQVEREKINSVKWWANEGVVRETIRSVVQRDLAEALGVFLAMKSGAVIVESTDGSAGGGV